MVVVADDGEAEREYNCVLEEAEEEDDGGEQVLEVNQEGKCYETWERRVEVEGEEEEQEERENDEWKLR